MASAPTCRRTSPKCLPTPISTRCSGCVARSIPRAFAIQGRSSPLRGSAAKCPGRIDSTRRNGRGWRSGCNEGCERCERCEGCEGGEGCERCEGCEACEGWEGLVAGN